MTLLACQILVLCATAILVVLSHLQLRSAERSLRKIEEVQQDTEIVRQDALTLLQENRRVIEAFHDDLLPQHPNPKL